MPIFGPKQIQSYAQEANQIPGIPQEQEQNNPAPEPKGLPWGYKAGMIGSNIFDGITTRRALESSGNNYESNPILRPIAGSTPGLLAAKGGIGLLQSYALDKLAKTHPDLARALSIGSMAMPTIAGISNLTKVK